jgi:DNA repair protein SbcD/Mre11
MPRDRFVFAHLADAHVGAWPRAPAVREALRRSVLRALEVAEERGAEFLLVSGDLFHTPVPDPAEAAPIAAALRRFVDAGRRIYVIYGSHDYVAHRTSWLDVLAAAGVFVKVAPEAVRTEGTRWTLPFLVDAPTGARIAGISGRSHGLDREYFRAVDSEAFREEPGFKVFQFHAAIEEYLPPALREHVRGIHRADLPTGCDYYAGGHIHFSYEGEGPGGGLLVNPGAVFGTSRTDLEHGLAGRTHQGVVIVTVENGRPRAEFVDTADREAVRLVDVDVTGQSVAEAREELEHRLAEEQTPGALLFPRIHGNLVDGTLASLALSQVARGLAPAGGAVTWDVRDLAPGSATRGSRGEEAEVERQEILALLEESRPSALWLEGPDGERIVRELLHELGEPRSEGESRIDYVTTRVAAGRKVLGVGRPPGS